jgi:hypothetical protein
MLSRMESVGAGAVPSLRAFRWCLIFLSICL